jgi:phage-related protein
MAQVTISVANPGVVTWLDSFTTFEHGLVAGSSFYFSTSGKLPDPLIPGVLYYVLAAGLTTHSFQFAKPFNGNAIQTTGTQSGVHTAIPSTKPVFSPIFGPSPGTQTNYELKLKKAAFGDGYSQVTRDGLNHQRRIVTLKWDILTAEMAKPMEDFFVEMGGDTAFLYALSDDTQRQWLCETYGRTRDKTGQFSATFREDFNLS